jgi:hypothetical protein
MLSSSELLATFPNGTRTGGRRLLRHPNTPCPPPPCLCYFVLRDYILSVLRQPLKLVLNSGPILHVCWRVGDDKLLQPFRLQRSMARTQHSSPRVPIIILDTQMIEQVFEIVQPQLICPRSALFPEMAIANPVAGDDGDQTR